MPPAPKHPSARARRNKTTTAATLVAPVDAEIPELPESPEDPHHPMTIAWWRDIWSSPMSSEFDRSDIHGLFLLAVLVDLFWTKPHWTTAAEIRLQSQRFGLSPLDRRRLQWEIAKVDEAEERAEARRARAATPKKATGDPRSFLKAV